MIIVAPATSANLGAGFDCLGVALSLPFFFAVGGDHETLLVARGSHPAVVAYRQAGGSADEDQLFWRSPIPPGRGLGFSGAARVAGAFAAATEQGHPHTVARRIAFEVATKLEGHPDNAAPSAFGGFCVAAADAVVQIPVHPSLSSAALVAWSPDESTGTAESRKRLADQVLREDAVFNAGRVGMMVAGLASGDRAAIARGCQDRLHQEARLEKLPSSAEALRVMWSVDPHGAWLSGSGPTVAALVPEDTVDQLESLLPSGGRVRSLTVDYAGVHAAQPV